MKIEHKTFANGYAFERIDGQPREELIEAPVPQRIVIPLQQGFGDPVSPLVEPGQTVRAGEIIGRSDDRLSSPVHASVNGVVESVIEGDGEDPQPIGIIIKSDGSTDWLPLAGHAENWEQLSAADIEDLIYRSGATALGEGGIPTRHKSALISPDDVRDLIVSGVDSGMYTRCLSCLLREDTVQPFVAALKMLRKVMPAARLHMVVQREDEDRLKEAAEGMAGMERTAFYTVDRKHPQGRDQMLVSALLDRGFPHGYSAANIGVVVVDVQTVFHVYDAVVRGKPVIDRVIALGGTGFAERPHVRVRVGTPAECIVEERLDPSGEQRIVINNPLTGSRLSDGGIPISRSFTHLIALPEDSAYRFLAFARPGTDEDSYAPTFLSAILPTMKRPTTNAKGESRPCVSCGFCEEVCPAGILPHLLHRYVEREVFSQRLADLQIFRCLDCNLCSYVCPCKIPVGKLITRGKEALLAEGIDNAAHVRPHFNLIGVEEPSAG